MITTKNTEKLLYDVMIASFFKIPYIVHREVPTHCDIIIYIDNPSMFSDLIIFKTCGRKEIVVPKPAAIPMTTGTLIYTYS